MAYSKRIATALISNGKILDEDPKGVIAVPFDSEFKVRVINKNDKKIGFDIYIDGVKVTKTGRIIVNPHDRIDLERYIENDDKGTKFRFVPKDSQEAKMDGKDKEPYTGIVEVRAYFEKERAREVVREIIKEYPIYIEKWRGPNWDGFYYHYSTNTNCGYSGISGFSGSAGQTGNTGSAGSNNFTSNAYCCSTNDMSSKLSSNFTSNLSEGAVVRGGNSNQAFTSTYVDLEEDYVSLKMFLMGYYEKPAEKKADEQQKEFDFGIKYCTKCGHQVKDGDNFCGKCGGRVNV